MRESNQVGSRCREHTLLENRILLYKTGAAILGIGFVARKNFGTSVLKLIGLKLSIPVALSRLRLSWLYHIVYVIILTRVLKLFIRI